MPPRPILLVAGTRPNFVKAAPLLWALRADPTWNARLLVVGQHRDDAMSSEILHDLHLRGEDVEHLILSGATTMGARLGEIIDVLDDQIRRYPEAAVVVFGDVDTTLAGAIAAKRAQRRLVHVEAGLRSLDRGMPEELNRLMVDAITDLHLATSDDALATLVEQEGQPADRVKVVGNLMIDSLLATADRVHGQTVRDAIGLPPGAFAIATFHRPSNVDTVCALRRVLALLRDAAGQLPVVLPLHPRTRAALGALGLDEEARSIPGLFMVPALRYRDFACLLAIARVVLTDSGGLQEESSVLGIPCLTIRENTERPITMSMGSNRLVQPEEVGRVLAATLAAPMPRPAAIPGWDGNAAARILQALDAALP